MASNPKHHSGRKTLLLSQSSVNKLPKTKTSTAEVESAQELIPEPDFEEGSKLKAMLTSVCKLVNCNIHTENKLIVDAIKSFVRADLEVGWLIEEDEKGDLIYHFQPDNKTTYTHPHINKLKATLVYLRQHLDEKELRKAQVEQENNLRLLHQFKENLKAESSPAAPSQESLKKTKDFQKKSRETSRAQSQNASQKQSRNPSQKPSRNPSRGHSRNVSQRMISPTKKNAAQKQKEEAEAAQAAKAQKLQLMYLTNTLEEGELLSNNPPHCEEIKIIKTNDNLLASSSAVAQAGISELEDTSNDPLARQAFLRNSLSTVLIHENFFIQSTQYYEKEYGSLMESIPKKVSDSALYRGISVERAMEIFKMFNLRPYQSCLFPFALLYEGLPLPPDVVELRNDSGCEYNFGNNSIKNVLRPTYFYILEMLDKLKDNDEIMKVRPDDFQFYDSLQRPFTINIRRVYSEWLTNPSSKHIINYTQLQDLRGAKGGVGAPSKEAQLTYMEKYKAENLKKMRDIMGKNYSIELVSDISSNMRDFHLFELAKQARLDVNVDIHLLFPIEEFVRLKENAKDPWQFRVKDDGTKYWINPRDMMASFAYPHLPELATFITDFKEKYQAPSLEPYLKDYFPFVVIASSPKNIPKLQACKDDTLRLMEEYFRLQEASSAKEINLRERIFEIKDRMQELVSFRLEICDFIDMMFFCEFDFEKYLQDKLDLERKSIAFLKNMNPNRELTDKIEQIRIKKKKQAVRMKAFKNRVNPLTGEIITREGPYSTQKPDGQPEEALEELGPAEDYLYLLDPELLKGDQPVTYDRANEIMQNLTDMDEMSAIIERCQLVASQEGGEINEEYLEKLLDDIKKLCKTLEQSSPNSLKALNSLKQNIEQKKKKLEDQRIKQEEEKRGTQKELSEKNQERLKLSSSLSGGVEKLENSREQLIRQKLDSGGSISILKSETSRGNIDKRNSCLIDFAFPHKKSVVSNRDGSLNRSSKGSRGQKHSLYDSGIENSKTQKDRSQFKSSRRLTTEKSLHENKSYSNKRNSHSEINTKQSLKPGTYSRMGSKLFKSRNTLPELDSDGILNSQHLDKLNQKLMEDLESKKIDFKGKSSLELEEEASKLAEMLPSGLRNKPKYREGILTALKLNTLNYMRDQLVHKIKRLTRSNTGVRLYKVISSDGRVLEKLSLGELRQIYPNIQISEEDLQDSSTDTLVFELNNSSTEPQAKRVSREDIIENDDKYLLNHITKELERIQADETLRKEDMSKFQNLNLYEEFLKNLPDTLIGAKPKEKETSILQFARVNNLLPTALKTIPELKSRLEFFILVWMRDSLKQNPEKISNLLKDSHKRAVFFKDNKELFDMVLETVLKKPHLYSKVKDFIFDRPEQKKGINMMKPKVEEPSVPETTQTTLTERSTKRKQFPQAPKSSEGPSGFMTAIPSYNNFSARSMRKKFKITTTSKKQFYSSMKSKAGAFMKSKEPEVSQESEMSASTAEKLFAKKFSHRKGLSTVSSELSELEPSTGGYRTARGWNQHPSLYQTSLDKEGTDVLAQKFGNPEQISRTVLNSFSGRLKIGDLEDVKVWARSLGIRTASHQSALHLDIESDLLWVAVLAYLLEGPFLQAEKNTKNSGRFSYYLETLACQRILRNRLKTSTTNAQSILASLSWIGFLQNDNEPIYINFLNGSKQNTVGERDMANISKYYNYGK